MARNYAGILIYSLEGDKSSLVFSLPGDREDQFVKIIGTALKSSETGGDQSESRIIKLTIYPKTKIRIEKIQLILPKEIQKKSNFFSNGYQSWSESREYASCEKQKPMRRVLSYWIKKYRLRFFGDEYFSRKFYKTFEIYSYTYTYIRDPGSDKVFFLGSLSEEDSYTLFARCKLKKEDYRLLKLSHEERETRCLIIERDCSGFSVSEPWCCLLFIELTSDLQEAFKIYARQWAIHNPPIPRSASSGDKGCITGWTSWYNYFGKVTEKDVLKVLNFYTDHNIPLDLFQIDDGWQTAVGDWWSVSRKFPSGMKNLADKIRKAGMEPGLWLAPFIAEEGSELFKKKPEWILKDKTGKFVEAGNNPFNWSGVFYPLDMNNQDVKDYLRGIFSLVINHWGFTVLKLDFLYAAAINPAEGKLRGKLMSEAMDFIYSCTQGAKILGCGVPLGTVFNKIDYCRIGSDVALLWEDLRLKFLRYKERVSTINSITNTVYRSPLNNLFFLNDPDVYILREENQQMSWEQRKSLFLINQIFGNMLLTSDDPYNYGKESLNLYLSQFPCRNKKIKSFAIEKGILSVSFNLVNETSMEEFLFKMYSNLTGRIKKVFLDLGFWYKEGAIFKGPQEIQLLPYHSHCFRYLDPEKPLSVLTSHLFPGSDVDSAILDNNKIVYSISEKSFSRGRVRIVVSKPGTYLLQDLPQETRTEEGLPILDFSG